MSSPSTALADAALFPGTRSRVQIVTTLLRFARRKPLGALGAAVLFVIVVSGLFSPWIATHDPTIIHASDALHGPTTEYWFGTDQNGRDIFSRIVYASQVTVMVCFGTLILVGFFSVVIGVVSGYFGGKVDAIVQRFVDIWMSFPAIFLILSLLAVLSASGQRGFFGLGRGPTVGPDPAHGDWIWYTFPRTTIVILVLGLVLAGGASRVVRSAVIATRANAYVESAVVVGASPLRVMFRHILPNIAPTVVVLGTLQMGTAVLAEATISFLGVGVTNFPTWGQMLSGKTRILAESHLYLAIFPGLAIFLAVFSFNMLGDALRDVLDPRLRGSE